MSRLPLAGNTIPGLAWCPVPCRSTTQRLGIIVVLALAASAACTARSSTTGPPQPPEAATLSIVATTDLHGRLDALPWLGGFVKIVRDARQRDGGAVLLVDSGDLFQGTLESNLTEGAAVIRAYNELGYTAAAIGNHEFDFGPVGPHQVVRTPGEDPRGALIARAREARFPLLSANVRRTNGGPWSEPNIMASTIVEAAGIRVGMLGVTALRTADATDPRNVAGLEVTPLAEAIVREATQLRAAGATVVLVLAHAGGLCRGFDSPDDLGSCEPAREIFAVAQALPPGLVDVIAGGHTHQGVAHRVNGIAVIQAFADGRAFGRVDLRVDRRSRRVLEARIQPPRFLCGHALSDPERSPVSGPCDPGSYDGQPVRRDERVARVLSDDVRRAATLQNRPIGVTLETPFTRAIRRESAAGNLVADLMRAARPAADVAVYNGGGVRADLPAGPLTYGRLFELVPFDSTLASAEMTVATLERALARSLERGMMPILSGARADARCVGGGLRVALQGTNGRVLAGDTRLTVLTSEFLAVGGDGIFDGLQDSFRIELEPTMRDALAEALSRVQGPLRADDASRFDAASPRVAVAGPMPLRCRAA